MTGRRLPSYRRPRSLHLHLHHDRHRPPRPYRFIRRDGVRQRVGTEGRRRSETSSCVAATGTHCSKRRTKAARAPTRTHLSVGSFSQDSGCQSGGRAQTAGRIRPSVQLAAEKRSRPRGASYSVSCRGEARRGQGEPRTVPAGARRAAAELAGPGMSRPLLVDGMNRATNKIDDVGGAWRTASACLHSFANCFPVLSLSNEHYYIYNLQLFEARSSKGVFSSRKFLNLAIVVFLFLFSN